METKAGGVVRLWLPTHRVVLKKAFFCSSVLMEGAFESKIEAKSVLCRSSDA